LLRPFNPEAFPVSIGELDSSSLQGRFDTFMDSSETTLLAKDSLTATDAKLVEDAFERRLSELPSSDIGSGQRGYCDAPRSAHTVAHCTADLLQHRARRSTFPLFSGLGVSSAMAAPLAGKRVRTEGTKIRDRTKKCARNFEN
jgi:hypothetical protein